MRQVLRCNWILCWIATLIIGCESRYSYQPVTSMGGVVSKSRDTIGDVKFTMGSYDTAQSAKSIIQNLFIDNNSTSDVVVLGGDLETGSKTVSAKIYRDAEGEKERTVGPKFSKSVGLAFNFDAPASEALGKDIVWIWYLRIGEEEHSLRVPMRRN